MATPDRLTPRRSGWLPLLLATLALAGTTAAQAPAAPAGTAPSAEKPTPAPAATSGADGAASVAWVEVPRVVDPVIVAPVADLPAEHRARRAALATYLGGPALVWIPARGADELDPFFQDDDFQYLTGVEIADIALLLVIGDEGELLDEVLYLPPHSEMWERWNGARLAPGEDARAATGFASTAELPGAAGGAGHGLGPSAGPPDTDGPPPWTAALATFAPETIHVLAEPDFPAPEGKRFLVREDRERSGPLRRALDALRLVKSPYEIACLRAAIDITTTALLNTLPEIRPGAYEYQPQGALEGTFLRLGAERPGFASICGSGPNSVTLHYNSNRRRMEAGDLLVMDVGAKYRYYCADVTRTVPVSGTFTPRQREIYEVVLAAQTAAAEAARPGMTIKDLDGIARSVIAEAGYGDYFVHGVGHWIGLDVHDVGGRVPIVENCLFTIEPGIYIPDEDLGVRIEDDYLMTQDGAVRLSTGFPSDPDAIESLMAGPR